MYSFKETWVLEVTEGVMVRDGNLGRVYAICGLYRGGVIGMVCKILFVWREREKREEKLS